MEQSQMVANILATYDVATPIDHDKGGDWYRSYGDLVRRLGATYGYGHAETAAAFAWLSPRVTVARNVELLIRLLERKGDITDWDGGLLNFARNAAECLSGNFSSMAFRDPLTRKVRDSRKVRTFWRNLLGDDTLVTLDTHAASIAMGAATTRNARGQLVAVGQPKGKAYLDMQAAYVHAAALRGVSPVTMQAVTWVTRRGAAD